MSGFLRVFDPLDLEIMDRVFEAVWARVEAMSSHENHTDDELRETVRKLVGTCAANGKVEFDPLYEKVCRSLPDVVAIRGWNVELRD
jgi:hypothetical protein